MGNKKNGSLNDLPKSRHIVSPGDGLSICVAEKRKANLCGQIESLVNSPRLNNHCGATSFRALQDIVRNAAAVITNDSAVCTLRMKRVPRSLRYSVELFRNSDSDRAACTTKRSNRTDCCAGRVQYMEATLVRSVHMRVCRK